MTHHIIKDFLKQEFFMNEMEKPQIVKSSNLKKKINDFPMLANVFKQK